MGLGSLVRRGLGVTDHDAEFVLPLEAKPSPIPGVDVVRGNLFMHDVTFSQPDVRLEAHGLYDSVHGVLQLMITVPGYVRGILGGGRAICAVGVGDVRREGGLLAVQWECVVGGVH